jgi:curved DNA-binding protein CbpA
LTIATKLDAYEVLQVDPAAHQVVIRAAYHALARQYHPDGPRPDSNRMAELNHAYDQVRDEERRRAYDDRRRALGIEGDGPMTSVGPGYETSAAPAAPPPNGDRAAHAGPFARRAEAQVAAGLREETSAHIDFGRYAGWSLRDLTRQDPDYVRWLSRHSSGVRFRAEILQLMPDAADR